MKKTWLIIALSLFLVGCSNNNTNKIIGSERINGTDISISDYSLDDNSIKLNLLWKHGDDQTSSSKTSFNNLGISTIAFQSGRELFYDASQANELMSPQYDGEENNSSLGFELNNLNDVVEVRFGNDGNYETPGIFISLNEDKSLSEDDKLMTYYKNEYFTISDNFYEIQTSLVNREIGDTIFLVSENDKIQKRMERNLQSFDDNNHEFKDDIQELVNYYGDFSEMISDIYDNSKTISKERAFEISFNIGKASVNLSDKYFGGELPESLGNIK